MVHDRWWRMGDMGCRDRLGRFYLLDREVDQIQSIDSSLAIEDTLMSRLEELREVIIVVGVEGEPIPVGATLGERPTRNAAGRPVTPRPAPRRA